MTTRAPIPSRPPRRTRLRAATMIPWLFLLACHGATEPLRPNDLEGDWFTIHPPTVDAPGVNTEPQEFELLVRDTLVTGRGWWGTGENVADSLVVTGVVHGTAVELDFVAPSSAGGAAAPPSHHFSGTLASPTALSGTLSGGASTRAATYQKALIG